MVKKTSDKWNMSVYYFDLNKACLKDTYPFSNIDQLNMTNYEFLSFHNAYSGYNQIHMYPSD